MLSTAEALKRLNTGAIVSITVISYDRTRKKGGQVLEYAEAQLLQKNKQPVEPARPMTKVEQQKARLRETDNMLKKDPHHKANYTRNVRLMQDGQPTSIIKKIHPLLIIEMDGETVTP